MSHAEAVVAASVVLGVAFLILTWPGILRTFLGRLAGSLFAATPNATSAHHATLSGTFAPRRAFSSLLPAKEEECSLLGMPLAVGVSLGSLGEPERSE